MTALSWQTPPVTKCGECKHERNSHVGMQCELAPQHPIWCHSQNKDGITESCPMWQQQNKDKK